MQTCTIEVWGPKRYVSTKDTDTNSFEDIECDRLYYQLVDYLTSSTDLTINYTHTSADNYFKLQDKQNSHSLSSSKKPITVGPPFNHLHRFQYKGAWITLERTQQPQISCELYPYEKIKFSAKRCNRALIYNFLETALKSSNATNNKENSVQLYTPKDSKCTCCVESWEKMGEPRSGRPLTSVILGDGLKEKLVQDFSDFLNSRQWYENRHIPYCRGYLLYGPPGGGKSSLIKALATMFNHSICLLSFTSKDLNDYTLLRQINSAPENSIILMEDIDSVFKSREDEFAESSEQNLSFGGFTCCSTVTFSGLLNALDGVLGGEDQQRRIIFMTTNHLDKLDSALIRPGRIDVKVFIDYAGDIQIEKMYKQFYGENAGVDADEFVEAIKNFCGSTQVTMAMVQGLLLRHKGDDKAVEWGRESRKYFKELEETCPYQRKRLNEWGLYV